MYAKFDTLEQFDAWHSQVMLELGIPNKDGTTSYTRSWPSPTDESVVALINDEVDSSTLTLLSNEEAMASGYLPTLEDN